MLLVEHHGVNVVVVHADGHRVVGREGSHQAEACAFQHPGRLALAPVCQEQDCPCGFLCYRHVVAGLRSRPTSTLSVLERSPMIFFTGVGRRRTSVGTAMIWSPLASLGRSSKSMT